MKMEMGEGSGGASIKIDKDKYLKARVVEIDFDTSYTACRDIQAIKAPHWPAGNDGFNQSRKAAVLQLGKGKTNTAKVTVEIDSKGFSGTGKLTGSLGQLIFEGEVPLSSKRHEVTVSLKETPKSLHWEKGVMAWQVDGGEHVAMAGVTNLELFFVFYDPAGITFFNSKGVWIEALRFIFKEARLQGIDDAGKALRKVTQCCFELPQHKYEIGRGSPMYGGASTVFKLKNYMDKSVKDDVNCYDQTYAVITFSGALGLKLDGIFLQPYGYLKYTELVGRGACNNPFPLSKYQSVVNSRSLLKRVMPGKTAVKEDYLVVDPKDEYRAGFGNHMFCSYSKQIYDACAGAATGENDLLGYMKSAIDIEPNIPEKMMVYEEGVAKPYQVSLERTGYPRSEAGLKAYEKYKIKYINDIGAQVERVE